MTVQELIDELNKVEDKTLKVYSHDFFCNEIDGEGELTQGSIQYMEREQHLPNRIFIGN